jgi:hypothetical protein
LVLLAVLTTWSGTNVHDLACRCRAAVTARAIRVYAAGNTSTARLCRAHQGTRAATILTRFRTVLNVVRARGNGTRLRLRVTDFALAVRVRQAALPVEATLRACDATTVHIGFIAVLNGIEAAWRITSLARNVADLA